MTREEELEILVQKADRLMRLGFTQNKSSYFMYAASIYSRVLEYSPDPMLYFQRGHCLQSAGKMEEAVDDYSKALALVNTMECESSRLTVASHIRVTRAGVLCKLGRMEEAREDYTILVNLFLDDLEQLHCCGLFLNNAGGMDAGGMALCSIEEDILTRLKVLYINRGTVFEHLGDPEAAVRDYSNALAISKDKETYRRRALVLFRQGKPEETVRDLVRGGVDNIGNGLN